MASLMKEMLIAGPVKKRKGKGLSRSLLNSFSFSALFFLFFTIGKNKREKKKKKENNIFEYCDFEPMTLFKLGDGHHGDTVGDSTNGGKFPEWGKYSESG